MKSRLEILPYLIDSKKTADEVNSYEKQTEHNDNLPFTIHLLRTLVIYGPE